jgi:type II secretory pathway pseudopilin PulG
MKCVMKKSQGVTLLEILLVLAIAAMIIVMSIRYYQSASTSEQVNLTMEEIQAITAAMDNLAIGSGAYNNPSVLAGLSSVVGSTNLISATGQTITVAAPSPTTYTVSIPVNAAICTSVVAKLAAISKIQNAASAPACSGSGTLSYTYDNTK